MSLFDLQDVCIAIGSIVTLDLPMVVDLIGIYGLKGPYCTLTMTDWFLQALSVIPRGSWGDVARRFTMIRWAVDRSDLIGDRSYDEVAAMDIVIWTRARWAALSIAAPSSFSKRRRRPPCAAASARRRRKFVSGQLNEENPFVQNSSALLVQPDEGVSVLVVDRIGDYLPQSTEKSRVLVIPVGARHKCQQGIRLSALCMLNYEFFYFRIDRLPAFILCSSAASPGGGSGSPTGSTSSSEGEGTSSPPSKASRKRLLARINADEARLIAEGRPWYEVRASLLQESDKATIKDLSGLSDHYEIMIPVALDWGVELSRRVSNAREVVRSSRRSLDKMMLQHDKLMRDLEDVHGASDAEKRSLTDKLAASEAFVACLQEEMKKMRANDYSDTVHPASFLSVLKALEDFPEEGEVESSSAPKK
ncbi:CAP-Gly domain-containing linker protein 1-like [Dorcoceras hygrometricum]|uniref:CAP-Gly domain-containing linker protein 1-like n=1 Tax=Dorcoceras hygrometricum TaxID=472368 RepID=A0A2Z7C7F0_9LAMI|nr:CAP-Gly domain-containing linker protein 1-like [Dorcoceras hygrometricum]